MLIAPSVYIAHFSESFAALRCTFHCSPLCSVPSRSHAGHRAIKNVHLRLRLQSVFHAHFCRQAWCKTERTAGRPIAVSSVTKCPHETFGVHQLTTRLSTSILLQLSRAISARRWHSSAFQQIVTDALGHRKGVRRRWMKCGRVKFVPGRMRSQESPLKLVPVTVRLMVPACST